MRLGRCKYERIWGVFWHEVREVERVEVVVVGSFGGGVEVVSDMG